LSKALEFIGGIMFAMFGSFMDSEGVIALVGFGLSAILGLVIMSIGIHMDMEGDDLDDEF
jgi:threonine/homoserine efflux transporter RhtA